MDDSGFSSVRSSFIVSESPQCPAIEQNVLKMLKSRIFLGRYVERRFVSESIGYRDIIILSPAEEELQRDLTEVVSRLVDLYPTHWIGITDTENLKEYKAGICLWTEIDDKPLGPFWFQIKSVQFRPNEILVQVKCLRYITDRFLELEPFLVQQGSYIKSDSTGLSTQSLQIDLHEIQTFLKQTFTLKNAKDCLFMLIALIIGLFTGSFALISNLGTFVLALVRESSNLINNSTPLLLGCLDFISKIVGGFYILIAMIFKPSAPVRTSDRYIEHSSGDQHDQYSSRESRNANKYNDFYSRNDFD